MAKNLECFLGFTFILAQQPLQILQASCAHQDKIGATLVCFYPSAISYSMSEICVSKTYASSRHPCCRPYSPCRPPHVILDPSQPTKASPHPDLAFRQACDSTIVLDVEATPAKQHEERVDALILGRIKGNKLDSCLQPRSVCDSNRLARRNIRHANC